MPTRHAQMGRQGYERATLRLMWNNTWPQLRHPTTTVTSTGLQLRSPEIRAAVYSLNLGAQVDIQANTWIAVAVALAGLEAVVFCASPLRSQMVRR